MGKPKDLLQGTLDLLILKAVSLGPLHGYGILLRIQQISQDRLEILQGSLYPALYRLEHQGWISGEWGESENKRKAKYYHLTASRQDGNWPAETRKLEPDLAEIMAEYSAHLTRRNRSLCLPKLSLVAAVQFSGAPVMEDEMETELRWHFRSNMWSTWSSPALRSEEARRRAQAGAWRY